MYREPVIFEFSGDGRLYESLIPDDEQLPRAWTLYPQNG